MPFRNPPPPRVFLHSKPKNLSFFPQDCIFIAHRSPAAMKNQGRRIGDQISRVIRAPLRALCHARNQYVRSMNSVANRFPYGAGGETMSFAYTAGDEARSFSSAQISSGEEDFRELIRVSSQSRAIAASEAVWRSRSVAVGRIDEDGPCYFSGEVGVGESLIFPRSRTCGAGGNRVLVVPV
ncbi:hypothetical protein KFK09_020887 [Dendrobium nobile]|uniref:Uncharacterized protein n=1 Tax=Dendrobium nobile TaxID=94219 RepID=A0A8T3ANQ2_DENNO|nr:hypothetical protein KFK09_020887 [Dendrobium nobile]